MVNVAYTHLNILFITIQYGTLREFENPKEKINTKKYLVE